MSSNVADPGDYVGPGILDITLKSDKPLKSAKVKILTAGGSGVHREEKTPESSLVTFRAPRELSIASGLALRIKYLQQLAVKKTSITVTGEELLSVYKPGEEEKQIWKRSYGKVELVVTLEDPLRPTTERVLEICPKFRILVMGKSGVGKSSLINKAFGATDALVSDAQPGEADIDREILSEANPQFLLHDSRGFEQGEDDNFKIVQDFIKRREKEPQIKEKLHAIWLCFQIPTLGGRLMETGAEDFLKLKAAGKLGEVPIIAVFTKYDRIVTTERVAMTKAGLKTTIEEAAAKANAMLQTECIAPFENAVGKTIPHITVSIRPQYTNTLSELIKITFENVEKYIAEAAIVTGISQRINAQVKIHASIEVGKRKHWKGLTTDTKPGTLKNFIDVIHYDIVKVWNLEDKHNFLGSAEFKNLMLSSIDASEKSNADKIFVIPPLIRDVVKNIVEILSGPAGLIMIPIMLLGLDWVHERYRVTRTNLRRIMIYIVNLTIVMQNLFWIQSILATKPRAQGNSKISDRVALPIKRRFIKLAFNLYIGASDRKKLLSQINDCTTGIDSLFQVVSQDKRDATIDKIIQLINSSTISNKDAFGRRNGIEFDGSWESEEDEAW